MLKDKKIRYKLDLKNRELMLKIFRNCIFFFVIGIFVFFTIKYSPLISKLMNENYRLEFKENISQMGFKGVFIVLGHSRY